MPILRRGGRPGLLGMAARTAVVAGTATAVSGAVTKHQQVRATEQAAMQSQSYAAPAAPAAPPAPASPATDVVAKLTQLGELHQQGLLSAEEFVIAKQQLLGS